MLLQPILALILVQLLFGALPVASKFVLAFAHPLFVVVLRSFFAALFFFILYRGFSGAQGTAAVDSDADQMTRKGLSVRIHLRLMLLAFFGITFNQMALFLALPKTSAAIASIISPSIAIFTLLFSVFLGREQLKKSSLTAILTGVIGVLWVVNPYAKINSAVHSSSAGWADLLNVMSAASYAFYLAMVGRLPTQIGGLRFSLLFFVYGFLMNCLVMFGYTQMIRVGWIDAPTSLTLMGRISELPSSFWTGLVFLLLGATALTYFLNMWALQKVKPSLVGGFVCLQTVFGLFLSQTILHEPLTWEMFIGSLLIMSAVILLAAEHVRSARSASTVLKSVSTQI